MPDDITIFIIYFITITIVSFIVMVVDKQRSLKSNTARIPEAVIFLLSAIFGSVGVYLSMFALRHKTRKWYFQIGIPIFIFQNIFIFYTVFYLW